MTPSLQSYYEREHIPKLECMLREEENRYFSYATYNSNNYPNVKAMMQRSQLYIRRLKQMIADIKKDLEPCAV